MKTSSLKTAFAVALFAASISVFASSDKNTVQPADQVVASFDRLLSHAPAAMPATLPSASEADPLLAGLSSVLWEQSSYHLPVRSASLSLKPGREQ
ncbi:hypothetical protein [Noviherbaspirillum sp.]|uniref:hypothetical protein n=1 Tax=Noviherbaspirillum sp. TaxID=1926288 RepID=UPI002B4A75C2|nr:hypothetical protein [Noviherbaspirillum sp.]HJV79454.1 hypothetical protein [Noviherbaspirillum sp.]